ncbi:MATE family efflux transporter [Natronoarchaeum mannanilyticum]|uniref:MATE family efflux transporter n=1 Tax=Natronoarchaeum mannanilyticum TaxID=926360 RepID=UPI0031E07FBB
MSVAETVEDSLTDGSLVGPMVRLAWPIIVIQLLQVTYNVADTLWLGRYSAAAVGAMSLAFPVSLLLVSFAGGFTTGGSILVAQYTGADSDRSAGSVAGQTMSFVIGVGVLIGAVGVASTERLLGLFPSQQETAATVVPMAVEYLEVLFAGMPFFIGFYAFTAIMRGYGDTRAPMYVMAVSVLLNVVLDPFLIFGWWIAPDLGVAGAAAATIASRAVATLLGLWILFGTARGPAVSLPDIRPRLDTVRKIVDLGVPASIEQSTNAMALIAMAAMTVSFAPPVVAAYGLGNRLVSLVFLPAMGLGQATNSIVGQNLGAEKTGRAERAAWLAVGLCAGVMVVAAALAAAFARPIVELFIAVEDEYAAAAIGHGVAYLRISTIGFVFIAVSEVLLGAFRGAGNTRTAMAISMFKLWVVSVCGTYLLTFTFEFGVTGLWVGSTLEHVGGAVLALAWFARGTWKEAVIDDDRTGDPTDDGEPGGAPDDAPDADVPPADGAE